MKKIIIYFFIFFYLFKLLSMDDINPRSLKRLCTENIINKKNSENICDYQESKNNILSSLSENINDIIDKKLQEKLKKQKNKIIDYNIEYEIKGKYNINKSSENKLTNNCITIQNINIVKNNERINILDNFIIII